MRGRILIVPLIILFLAGCAIQGRGAKVKAPISPAPPARPVLQSTDLPDLVLPRELKIVQEKTLLVRTPSYVGGLITARGRVTRDSLVTFFRKQLAARGWKEMGYIKYKNVLLAFRRPNGSCFIYITSSGLGGLEVRIWASESFRETAPSAEGAPLPSYP